MIVLAPGLPGPLNPAWAGGLTGCPTAGRPGASAL